MEATTIAASPMSILPLLAVTVCAVLSRFIHVTVVFTGIVKMLLLNAKFVQKGEGGMIKLPLMCN